MDYESEKYPVVNNNGEIEELTAEEIKDRLGAYFQNEDGEVYVYRIRKLTPLESFRLMGFSDEDYAKAAAVNSKTQLLREAGNSIVKPVLMAIFSQLNIKGVTPWNERSSHDRTETN